MKDLKHAARYWFLRWRGMVWPWTKSGGLLLLMAVVLGSQTIQIQPANPNTFIIDLTQEGVTRIVRRAFECGKLDYMRHVADKLNQSGIAREAATLWDQSACQAIVNVFVEGVDDKEHRPSKP